MINRVTSQPKKNNKKEKKKQKPESAKDKQVVIVNNIQLPTNPEPELRTINLYGDITERKGADIIAALLYLENNSHTLIPEDPLDPESNDRVVARSISMMISTHGGAASDMFSILDVMEMIKERTCDIETFGIGKVMSAGVPILACGSPGRRKVGKADHQILFGTFCGEYAR